MLLDGLDEAVKEATRPQRRRTRRRRTRIGWRQVAAQMLYVLAVTASVVSLLCYGGS